MAHDFAKKWRSDDVRLQENVDFSALLLSDRILHGLTNAGFKKPSPIQLEAIPMGRFGKDLLVQAKSGTGKTLVFVIVALEMLKRKLFRPQIMVVVPTREIATQICSVVKAVGCTFPKLTCSSFIGGLPLFEDKEKAILSQIVIGTPGRLKQLIQLKSLPTNSIRLLVFDEADQLLDGNSFKDDIEDIFKSLPEDKQVIATSATYNSRIKKMLFRYLRDPHLVCLNAKELALLGMIHYAKVVDFCPMPVVQYRSKLAVLEDILKSVKFAQCLVFCNGIQRVEVLYRDIKQWGFSTAYISSAKEQCDRLKAIDRLKHFKCKVLVSSDLTARGIDAENVDLVINFDLSYMTETYMHRVGRAGRYGSVGVAISIVDSNELRHLKRIEKEGSFKVYKLPACLPVDLILHPPEGDYVFEEPELEDIDCSEIDKFTEPKETNSNVLGNNCNDVKNGPFTKSIEERKVIPKMSIHVDSKILIEPIAVPENEKCLSNITMCSYIENEVKVEKQGKDVIPLKDKNEKTIHFREETADIKLLEGRSGNENLINNNVKLSENKNIDLLNDLNNKKHNNNGYIDNDHVSNIHENASGSCSENISEQQDPVIKKEGDQLNMPANVNDNLEEGNFESFAKKLSSDIMPAPESLDNKDVNDKEKGMCVSCDKKNENESSNTLNNVIKAFLDTYENQSMKSVLEDTSSEESQLNSDKKIITINMINNLKSQKNDFFYKTFKKFQEGQCQTIQANDKVEGENTEGSSIPYQNGANLDADLVNIEVNAEDAKLMENLEFENSKKFSEKPNFESTPQLVKQENEKMVAEKLKLVSQNKLIQLFQELSDESDSDESRELKKFLTVESSSADSPSSDSESDSSSSYSESNSSSSYSESDSSSTRSKSSSDYSDSSSSIKSSKNEKSERVYNHTSLLSHPNKQYYRDQVNSRHMLRHKHPSHYSGKKCCHRVQQPDSRFSEMPRSMNRVNHMGIDQNTFVHLSHRKRSVCPRNMFHISSMNRNGQMITDHKIFEPHFDEKFLVQSGQPLPSRGMSRRRVYRNRHEPQNLQRSSRHHHTLSCFLPTEHRCHPNTSDYSCEQGSVCAMWYKTFYNQWLHIQSMLY